MLESKVCTSLLSREFWLDGELITPCCCMFIKFSDGSCLKAFFNDEENIWELTETLESPNLKDKLGDNQFIYPYKEYLPSSMSGCGNIIEKNCNDDKMSLKFSSGLEIIFSYDFAKEKASIEIKT